MDDDDECYSTMPDVCTAPRLSTPEQERHQAPSPVNEPLHIVTDLMNGIDISKHKQPHSFDSASTRHSEERKKKENETKSTTQQNGTLSSSPESGIGSEKINSSLNGMRARSMSESTIMPLKGILKRRNHMPVSHSFSASDNNGAYSSSQSLYDDSEMSQDECERLSLSLEHGDALLSLLSSRKSVRFNDKVQERVYRRNASITGQKKRNQKRAADRARRSSNSSLDSSDKEEELKSPKSNARPLSIGLATTVVRATETPRTSITTIKEQPIAEMIAAHAPPAKLANVKKEACDRQRTACRLPSYADTTDDEESYWTNDSNTGIEASNQSGQTKPLSKSQKKRIKRKKKNSESEQKVCSLEEPIYQPPTPEPRKENNHRPYDDGYDASEWTEVMTKSARRQCRQSTISYTTDEEEWA